MLGGANRGRQNFTSIVTVLNLAAGPRWSSAAPAKDIERRPTFVTSATCLSPFLSGEWDEKNETALYNSWPSSASLRSAWVVSRGCTKKKLFAAFSSTADPHCSMLPIFLSFSLDRSFGHGLDSWKSAASSACWFYFLLCVKAWWKQWNENVVWRLLADESLLGSNCCSGAFWRWRLVLMKKFDWRRKFFFCIFKKSLNNFFFGELCWLIFYYKQDNFLISIKFIYL